MNELCNGSTIRGNHGVDVFPRDDGYHVEHFALVGYTNECKVIWSDGPFTHLSDAARRMREYRTAFDHA